MKKVADSLTHHSELLMYNQLNGQNCLFGGELMRMIDMIAGVTARRHCGCQVVTACVDRMNFQAPAHLNDLIDLEARVTWVGHTSLEVRVDAFVESMEGSRQPINTAYLVMVAVNPETGKPQPVPPIEFVTEEEQQEARAAEERRAQRLKWR